MARNGQLKYASILTEEFLRQRYLEERQSTNAIAAECGMGVSTVNNYLRRYGMPIRTSAESNHNYVDSAGFDDLSTDWHAYWTGFIAADGCVFATSEMRVKVQVILKMSDAAHLRNLQEGLKANVPVFVGNNGQRDIARIVVHDPHFASALAKWGIVPNKTLTMPWPAHLPLAMVPAYIRGYFDGDGTLMQRHRVQPNTSWTETVCRFTSGNPAFLDGLEQELIKRGIRVLKRYRNQNSNAYVLPISGRRENLLAFADMIYQGSTVSLERKRVIFESLRNQSNHSMSNEGVTLWDLSDFQDS